MSRHSASDSRPRQVLCLPVLGLPEIASGDDLAGLLCEAAGSSGGLQDGDVLVVTSKVVSKADGLVRQMGKDDAVTEQTDRVLARRGGTRIVRNRQGLVMAGAGVDASNTEPGTVVLLPRDPDHSARLLRERVTALTERNVAVVVSDTSGRAWRNGLTDLAIGAAGLGVVRDYVGQVDGHGNVLLVTVTAIADEVASAADLVKGKLAGCPAAVVRGLDGSVLPRGEHGPGARVLVRDEHDDMFGHGAREAVTRAVDATSDGLRGFGRPAGTEELAAALDSAADGCGVHVTVVVSGPSRVRLALPAVTDLQTARAAGRAEARASAVAFAHGWVISPDAGDDGVLIFRPGLSVE